MSAGRGRAGASTHPTRRGRRRWAPPLGRAVVPALALLLAPPALLGAARSDPGKPDAPLQVLGEAFVTRSLTRAPHVATRGGDPSSLPLASTVTAAALAEERAWLRAFRERLAAVPRDEPAGERATERALLEAAVERDLMEAEVLRPFERDPGAYVALVAGSVEAALKRSGGTQCARLEHAARRLAEVPEVLRAARLNLKDPPRVLTELAIERFAQVLRFYREDVPRLTAGCRSARMQADVAQADTIAVRAVEGFLRYLADDLLPISSGTLAIGPDACRRWMHGALMTDVAPAETLLAEATGIVEARRAELEAIAPLVGSGNTRAALDALAAERPEDGGWVPLVSRAVERVEEFLGGHDVVSLPSRPSLQIRDMRSFRGTPGIALSDVGDPGEPRATSAWLEVGAPEGDGGARLGPFNRWELDLAVAHEGLPGRYLRAVAVRSGRSRLGRMLQQTWPGGDWGQYCEWMMLEAGYGGEDPRYRLAGAARALRLAGRALAALALQSGAMSPDDVRRMLEDRCLLAPAEADREARSAAADPAIMSYTFGAQRLRELQEEARRRLGPRYRTKAFNDAVLRCGASPPGILQQNLWRELADATGDDPVGAKP